MPRRWCSCSRGKIFYHGDTEARRNSNSFHADLADCCGSRKMKSKNWVFRRHPRGAEVELAESACVFYTQIFFYCLFPSQEFVIFHPKPYFPPKPPQAG